MGIITNTKGEVVGQSYWTIQDEAIMRGNNYAKMWEDIYKQENYAGISIHAMLKNAYQEGFLHGFEHKFDDTHYEEKDGDTL